MEEVLEDEDGNQELKCKDCDLLFRNEAILDSHIKIEHSKTNKHQCNACNKQFPNKDMLELHLVEKHTDEADCSKCNAFFKKEADYYQHANNCSEVIQLNVCAKCEQNIVSKAALKKHMPICKGKKQPIKCRNGESCRYNKAGRCSFFHPPCRQIQQPNNELNNEWHTVRHKSRKPLWTCRFCTANMYSREAGRNHICEKHNSKSVEQQLVERKRSYHQNNFPHKAQSDSPQLWCKYQDNCFKGQLCRFKHIGRDFLEGNLSQNLN